MAPNSKPTQEYYVASWGEAKLAIFRRGKPEPIVVGSFSEKGLLEFVAKQSTKLYLQESPKGMS